jgi:hypothetical protein
MHSSSACSEQMKNENTDAGEQIHSTSCLVEQEREVLRLKTIARRKSGQQSDSRNVLFIHLGTRIFIRGILWDTIDIHRSRSSQKMAVEVNEELAMCCIN